MKRIKHVFASRDELCHVWVRNNMNRRRGRYSEKYPEPDHFRSSNVYTRGRLIFSYGEHFCMAAFHPTRNDVVFVTDRTYSPSTSKHQSDVYYALPTAKRNPKYMTDQAKKEAKELPGLVTVVYCYGPEDAVRFDARNVDDFRNRLRAEMKTYNDPKRRPHTRAHALFAALRIVEDFRKYALFAGLSAPMKRLLQNDPELAKFVRNRKAKAEATKALKAYEARQKELEVGKPERAAANAAKRAAKRAKLMEEIAALGITPEAIAEFVRRTDKYPSPDDFGIDWGSEDRVTFRNAVTAYEDIQRAQQREADRIRHEAEQLERETFRKAAREQLAAARITSESVVAFWRDNGRFPIPSDFGLADDWETRSELNALQPDGNELLRIVGDEVHTSRHASVPLDNAKILYRAYMSGRPIHGHEIGGFRVIEATKDGVRIGCHFIARPEIENFGRMIAA